MFIFKPLFSENVKVSSEQCDTNDDKDKRADNVTNSPPGFSLDAVHFVPLVKWLASRSIPRATVTSTMSDSVTVWPKNTCDATYRVLTSSPATLCVVWMSVIVQRLAALPLAM
jgi:hypothetical protein